MPFSQSSKITLCVNIIKWRHHSLTSATTKNTSSYRSHTLRSTLKQSCEMFLKCKPWPARQMRTRVHIQQVVSIGNNWSLVFILSPGWRHCKKNGKMWDFFPKVFLTVSPRYLFKTVNNGSGNPPTPVSTKFLHFPVFFGQRPIGQFVISISKTFQF